jgi:molecular chaperone DnaK
MQLPNEREIQMLFAIDLGHCFTKCATVDQAGQVRIVPDADGQMRRDSCVLFPLHGTACVGRRARQNAILEPDRLAMGFKPLPVGTENILASDPARTKVDAWRELIRSGQADTERTSNATVTTAVTLVPHHWGDDRKDEQCQAFAREGLDLALVAPEQSAAAYAFGLHRQQAAFTALVGDFGASTSDLAVLAIEPGAITILAATGLDWGGADVDEVILGFILQAIEDAEGDRPTRESEPLFFLEQAPRIEEVKVAFNTQQRVPITVAWHGRQHVITLDREAFHERLQPNLQSVEDAYDRMVHAAGLQFSQIKESIAVGGTSRLVRLRDAITKHTGLDLRTDIDPEFTTVRGGALLGIEHLRRTGQISSLGTHVLVPRTVPFTDVTMHDVGCAVLNRETDRLSTPASSPATHPSPANSLTRSSSNMKIRPR